MIVSKFRLGMEEGIKFNLGQSKGKTSSQSSGNRLGSIKSRLELHNITGKQLPLSQLADEKIQRLSLASIDSSKLRNSINESSNPYLNKPSSQNRNDP